MSNPYETPDPTQPDPYSPPTSSDAAFGAQDAGSAEAAGYTPSYGQPTPEPHSSPYSAASYDTSPSAFGSGSDYAAPSAYPDPAGSYQQPSAASYQQPAADPYQQPMADPYQQSPAPYAATPYAAPADPYGQQAGYASYGQSSPYAAAPLAPYSPVLPDHPQSTMVLILGILSVVMLPILGPFAWFFGSKARKEVRQNPGVYKDGGMLTGGWITGIIGTVLLAFAALYVVLMVFLVILSSTM